MKVWNGQYVVVDELSGLSVTIQCDVKGQVPELVAK